MYEFRSVSLKFKKVIFSDFSYSFNDHGMYFISGPSGCGKSTLIKMLYFNHYKYSGNIFFNKENISEFDISAIEKIRTNIFYFSENNFCNKNKSLIDNIKFILGNDFDLNCATNVLNKLKLDNKINQKYKTLSAGEKQRFVLSFAFMQNRKIILIDEMISNLDEYNYKLILNMLYELRNDRLIIIVDHLKLLSFEDAITIDFINLKSNFNSFDYNFACQNNVKKKNYNNFASFSFSLIILIFLSVFIGIFITTKYLINFTDSKKEAFLQTFPLVNFSDDSYIKKYHLEDNHINCYSFVYGGYYYYVSNSLYYGHSYNKLLDNYVYTFDKKYYNSIKNKYIGNGIKFKYIDVPKEYNSLSNRNFFVNEKTFSKITNFLNYIEPITIDQNGNAFIKSDEYVENKFADTNVCSIDYLSDEFQIDRIYDKKLKGIELNDGEIFISTFTAKEILGISEELYTKIKNGYVYKTRVPFIDENTEFIIKLPKAESYNYHFNIYIDFTFLTNNDYEKYVKKTNIAGKIFTHKSYYNIDEEHYNNELLDDCFNEEIDSILVNEEDYLYRYNVYETLISSQRYMPIMSLIISILLYIFSLLTLNNNSKLLIRNNYNYRKILVNKIRNILIIFAFVLILIPLFTYVYYIFLLSKIKYSMHYNFINIYVFSFAFSFISAIIMSTITFLKQKYDFYHC